MSALGVWAPAAQQVELATTAGRRALGRGRGGWWLLPPPALPPDTDYRFVLDGGAPLPDPRSPFQPAGVHGPSRTVDHAAFRWTDARFVAPPLDTAVVYELHVGTFTPAGTFDGVIHRLDHLVDLGITHLSLMPVNQFPGRRGWGYDGVGLWAVQDAYGGPDGLKRLVDAAHARGLAVLLDVVYNHLGPDGNVLGEFGPYFTRQYATFWGPALNLDQAGSDEVRRFVCDNAAMWLRDYHLDGLRLDAVHALFDRSAVHLLEQLAAEIAALGAELGRRGVLIAESDLNDPRLLWPREAGGFGLDAQWSDDLHHALHVLLTGERSGYYADFGTLEALARALQDGYVYQGDYSPCRGRRHGRSPAGVARWRCFGYLQSHDQIGNRARGERIAQLISPARARLGAGLVLTSPAVPMLFMGEEWGASSPFLYFTDHTLPGLAERVREGRRAEFAAFGWRPEEVPDPNDEQTFLRSRLDWSELDRGEHATTLAWYRALLRLRRERPELRAPLTRVRFDEAERWLIAERPNVAVCANLAERSRELAVGAGATLWLAAGPDVGVEGDRVRLPPDGFAVVGVAGAAAR